MTTQRIINQIREQEDKAMSPHLFKGHILDFFDTAVCTRGDQCGKCHSCGTVLRCVLDGEEYCDTCAEYRRYPSHGWSA